MVATAKTLGCSACALLLGIVASVHHGTLPSCKKANTCGDSVFGR
ncbi:hypothetical protein DSBG_3651 [Desulfosporosinus sp. BG]|nr:hypothetical protein DSBG_3651 [Desulfosporosinus sp. BG]